MRRIAAAVLVLAAALPARADEVTLTTGERLEGRVTRVGDRVVIELDWGTMTVPADRVTRIALKPSPLQEFLERRNRLADRDVAGRVELAAWARERELYARERDLWREVVALEPDHAAARAALGYRRIDGRWMTDEEYFTSQGKIRLGSLWVTPAEAAEIARREREAAAEAARQAEAMLAQQARVEAERARAETERLRAEVERLRWESFPRWTWRWRHARCPR